jgi:hypothetical protein
MSMTILPFYTEKLLPQPQVDWAFGLVILKLDPVKSSL